MAGLPHSDPLSQSPVEQFVKAAKIPDHDPVEYNAPLWFNEALWFFIQCLVGHAVWSDDTMNTPERAMMAVLQLDNILLQLHTIKHWKDTLFNWMPSKKWPNSFLRYVNEKERDRKPHKGTLLEWKAVQHYTINSLDETIPDDLVKIKQYHLGQRLTRFATKHKGTFNSTFASAWIPQEDCEN